MDILKILDSIKDISKISYIKGNGKGGQKINKTNSCAEVRFDVFDLPISDDVKIKLIKYFGQNNITLKNQSSRSRNDNLKNVWAILNVKLHKALHENKPRVKTLSDKQLKKSKDKKRKNKIHLSNKKRNRRYKISDSSFAFIS